jgi:hypothetical protein
MVYEDLDAGDETRRNGDYVAFPHGSGDGVALDSVPIPQGALVYHDGSKLVEATADADEAIGVLANYDVSGDTGKETVGPDGNVKMRGEVIADLTNWDGTGPTVGAYLGNAGTDILVAEEVDSANNLYRVQVQ